MALHPIQIEHKLFTVDEYELMISAGILAEDDRLELIEGEIIRPANSQPQPDLTLLYPAVELRPNRVPSASDVLLLIEVADTTARFDQAV